jgi:hypothetical protein
MSVATAAGYIVHDTEGLIHGRGVTPALAWADMLNTMRHAMIEVVADDDDSEPPPDSWVLASDMVTTPATAALLQLVEDHGGNCTWGKIGLVACTVAEEEAD